ncbi:hypothetical protein ACFWYW_35545 [Nonomuraea sp. NPDC059023]|uniref:hypothetical protein n=1 Tax=unclassified Nonomuraea TaxID=2593643 RepID=UPI003689DFED
MSPLHVLPGTLYSADPVDQALLLRLSVEGLYSVVNHVLEQIWHFKAPGGKDVHFGELPFLSRDEVG